MRIASLLEFARLGSDAAWSPDSDLLSESRAARFVRASGEPSLDDVQRRATADPAWFWGAAADDLGLSWQRRPTQVLDLDRGVPWARWWRGAAFNYAAAALDSSAASDREALAWEGEDGEVRRLTRAELRAAVDRAAAMLSREGVGPGARVAIFLPMIPETVVAVLALGKLQAVFTPIFSGYAAHAVATRLRAFEATHLITADGFRRRGSIVPIKATADDAVRESPSVTRVLVVERIGSYVELDRSSPRDRWWHEALAEVSGGAAFETAETDPEAPFMVIYTSGTTGAPKGTVHVHGGFPIKAAQDLAHTFDLRPDDTLFWFTDLGWMMGPWLIAGGLLLGARIVIYEGAPDHPAPDRIWAMVERHRVTHLGVSPTLVRALAVHGTEPVRAHDRSSLRVLGSTGELWNPDAWWWYFREVGDERLPIVNYSGGTEVAGGILGCSLLRPIRPTSFNGPCLGMGVDVVDSAGLSLRGEVGELVIRTPWPGMTRGFWGGDEERYLETYWRRMPGLWVHGDWTLVDDDAYWYLFGRSDDTLKIAGKRVGPAEVEAAAVAHAAVVEAAAIGAPDPLKGESIVVLVVLRPGITSGSTVAAEVAELVVRDLGKTCRPSAVVQVPDLPRTRSGKIMRRVARAAYLGIEPGDLSALENPLAVEAIAAVGAQAR
ncbi:MAG TPA: AMP-binding protein [Candidatus Saccharimonadales bacterium]|nr:AMP-binding protein [Candidatus Saccharimonadales bacterium]